MPLISQPTATGSYGLSETETTEEISGADTHGGESTESNAMRWTSQEDELASALEDCVSVLRSGLQRLQDISVEDLVFCEPLKDADPLIPPPLQIIAIKNLPFLRYHDWIMTLYSETQKLDCGMFERCERIKHSLLHDLRNEWTKLDELKRRAWQMASLRSPEPGSAQIINTCECIV
jgi:hypothetical protein